ncbi:MAG: thiamine biosynthesis lipoprotein [Planctomycetota bacterium]|jgi:thiamine biosynthesis lipoprotein
MFRRIACCLLTLGASCAGPARQRDVPAEPVRTLGKSSSELAPATAQAPVPLRSHKRRLGVMGTELTLEALHSDAQRLEQAIDAAITEIQRVEDLMTDWRPSPLMELNAQAGMGPVAVDPELVRLIDRSLKISELTGGAFDITYASVGKLWDFKRVPPVIPSQEQIHAAVNLIGYKKLRVDVDAATVDLPQGMRLGLGGIAKGYGVDRAMSVLLKHGIEHASINAGGDLKVLGLEHGEAWRVSIRHPRNAEQVIALVPMSNSCLLTSGDYERFFMHEGRRYHHIIDPRSGMPSSGCISSTVRAPDAAFADALATALCVLQAAQGIQLVESLPGVDAILVDMDGQVHMTSGLSGERRVVPDKQ